MTDTTETLVEIARKRAANEPERTAYTSLEFHPERRETALTYGELHRQASAIAGRLRGQARPGDRALLLYGNGLEWITAFFGCLYAGVLAVPAPLGRRGPAAERVRGILEDCGASAVLCARAGHKAAAALAGPGPALIVTDELPALEGGEPAWISPSPEDIAFLQYSSGSTGAPRGVMVTHANLLSQAALLRGLVGARQDSCMVSWLPLFHDMGLIAGVVEPMYGGFPSVLMSPEAFVESPRRWLEALSDFRGTFSAAPNFAYDLCTRRVPEEARRGLDLSRWRFAAVAAEPVRAGSLDAFAAAFGPCGFGRAAFRPGYGLAENTLVATLGNGQPEPRTASFQARGLEANRVVPCPSGEPGARALVGCGVPAADQTLLIAGPDGERALPGQVGEVWLAGPSVGAGYWGRERETAEVFGARLAGGAGPYLKTGDLGFLHEGELFVCGRLKDLIILAGRNHHAPDIEATIEGCHPALVSSGSAAFPFEPVAGEEERLVVVCELERSFRAADEQLGQIVAAIRQAVVERHEIDPHDIVLVKQGSLPRTSSGKVQRIRCRRAYAEAALATRAQLRQAEPQAKPHTETELWLIEELARRGGIPAAAIGPETAIGSLGLAPSVEADVVRAVELRYSCMLPKDILSDFPTVGAMAAQLDIASREASAIPSRFAQSSQSARGGGGTEPIAIVGMGCRFPGASSPRELWDLLCAGRESVTDVPFDRWDVDEFYDPNAMVPGKMTTRRGGFVDGIDGMDRLFFELSVRETVRMDPQHRLMLETAWEAIEDAGIPVERLSGTPVGVFVGIQGSDYAQRQFTDPALADAYAGQGSALTVAASRISHFFNFLGPAIAIDTACSSSLSAVHLACNSIQSGESTVALAGGVNILLSPIATMCLSKAGMMAPDGRCKSFDAGANGYVRAEGAGVVVLKRLSQALADGDAVYAVIRGTASNQDGHSSGLMAPNGEAQEAVILAACRNAGVEPGAFDYVEAHGTGTPVGDPIELKALGKVLAMGREPGTVCAVGSVKTNIGHAESAAGMAGLIKAALVLRHRQIPASLHFNEPNPMIPFDAIPVRIPTALGPLPERDRPSLAGVNGFGVGGTNVHIVLEEAVPAARRTPEQAPVRPWLLPLSARSAASLRANAAALAQALEPSLEGPLDLHDLCFTAATRRSHLDHRLAVAGRSAEELREALEGFASAGQHAAAVAGNAPAAPPKLAFVFSGQGSQWFGMGRSLLEREPVFRAAVERIDALLREAAGWSLLDLLMLDELGPRLDETEYVQPALFALQVATAALLRSWGVEPDAVAGHSVGEVAAAHVAGALTLADAVRLIAHRGRLMQAATGLGRMVNVELGHEEIEAMLNGWSDRLSVAAVNGPQSVVLSGDGDAMLLMLEKLDSRRVNHMPLPVNYAFHSPQMDPFKAELEAALAGLETHPCAIPMMSTVTADWCAGEALGAPYWSANMRLPVMLAPAIEALDADGFGVFLEIGPHAVLSGSIARTLKARRSEAHVVSTLRRDADEGQALTLALGALYTLGRPPAFARLYPEGKVVHFLPAYGWDRQRYWLDLARPARRLADAHPLLGLRLPVARPTWQKELDTVGLPWLGDMQRHRHALVPPNAFVEAALAAASETFDATPFQLTDVVFGTPAALRPGSHAFTLQAAVSGETGGTIAIEVFSRVEGPEAPWQAHLTARAAARPSFAAPAPLDFEALAALCPASVESAELYGGLDTYGLHYGPGLRHEAVLRQGVGHARLTLRLPEEILPTLGRYRLHPVVLEAATQAARLAHGLEGLTLDPSGMQRIRVLGPCPAVCELYARTRALPEFGETIPRTDISLAGEDGAVFATVEGLAFGRREAGKALAIPDRPDDWLYEPVWQEAEREAAPAAEGAGVWMFLADQCGVADRLLPYFEAHGDRCLVVRHGGAFARAEKDRWTVDANDPAQLQRFFEQAFPERAKNLKGIMHLWSLDATPAARTTAASLAADGDLSARSLLFLVQAVAAAKFARAPRLFTVTGGVHAAGAASPAALEAAQSMVWGLSKTLTIEHAELRPTCIDLSGGPAGEQTDAEIEALYAECLAESREDAVALRGSERFVRRLLRPAAAEGPEARHAGRRAAGPDEVEIRLAAVRLTRNGPGGAPCGDGCVGTIVGIGGSVENLVAGDEVVVLEQRCYTGFLTVQASRVAPKPHGLGAAEAAASVRPLVTALFALEDVAHLRAGGSVLIHGACTELGLAAVQIARGLGARVLASARGQEERAKLEALGLAEIVEEDSLASPAAILAFTGRKGVDVLLNCREGAPVPETVEALAPFGRYLDGTRDGAALLADLRPHKLRGGVSLHAVDLAFLLEHAPDRAFELLGAVAGLLGTGDLKPGAVRTYTRDEALPERLAEADETAVVVFPEPLEPAANGRSKPVFRADATYLITGGLGGLGLGLAESMVHRGARHLLLLGRRAPSPEALEALARMRREGATIAVEAADVADEGRLRAILEAARATMPPLGGVMHAAGALANDLVVNMTPERWAAALPSKVAGAWNLHTLTRNLPLDFFVLFSSLASLLGSPGQGNYAAANGFLDGLAAHRRQAGLPALAVCWGPWSEIGMAAAELNTEHMAAGGLGMIPPAAGFALQERLLGEPAGPVVGAIAVDWLSWAQKHPSGADWPFVTGLVPAGEAAGGRQGGRVTFARLAQLDAPGRLACLEDAIRDAVCESLRLDPSSVGVEVPLSAVGLDSIVGLELKSRLEAGIDVVVQTVSLLKGPSIRSLAAEFLTAMAPEGEAPVEEAAPRDLAAMEPEHLLEQIGELSNAEVETLLATLSEEAPQ